MPQQGLTGPCFCLIALPPEFDREAGPTQQDGPQGFFFLRDSEYPVANSHGAQNVFFLKEASGLCVNLQCRGQLVILLGASFLWFFQGRVWD